ncbi:type VII secretion-associated serine protease mycosin [Streptomyces canus]|uniref:Type VII secretion-associated serine protease mycosin n=1 Tax=Streptomyces canus TaxID=58343 RepID=A0AAW8FD72_9ACTN|nr:S8 family serine peptidase [Streptomyces canus]MDQ0907245.1 type VII secretion-associated serine protease mycosin [Streptomyces canus]
MALTRTVRALSAAALTGALLLTVAPTASADQTRRDQWALETLQAESAWKISQGKGVTVAVIDDGVNAGHIDLKNNVLKGKDFVDGDDDASPVGDDHGTGMASIIAGHGHGFGATDGVMGLAPESKILPIRSDFESDSSFADEIRYAVDQGASIINISVAVGQESSADREAVTYALKHDVLMVTASGNNGQADEIYFPGEYPGTLTVGGVDKTGEIWKDSNYGPEVMLTAPATRIVTAGAPGNRLRIGDGTSDSAAFVSGAAALLRAKFPNLTAGQIANRLVKTAVLPDSAKGISLPDEKYGYGEIRPFAALTENIPAGSKYGPLAVPQSGSPSAAASASPSDTDSAAEREKADQKQMLFFVVLGVVALVVVGLIVLLIVKLSRRNKNNNGGPGGPAPYQQYGQQPFPPQQNPYQQSAQPQQNPYQQQPTPPHSQWPPQQ